MITAFMTTLVQMARILLFLVTGFCLNRLHILRKETGICISRLVTMVFLPAMVAHNNMMHFNLADVGNYGMLVLLGGALWGVVTLLAMPVAKKMGSGNFQERGVYLYGLSFPNTGAVGTPLAIALLGSAGYFRFGIFLLVFSIMTYAWGVGLFLDVERKNRLKRFFIHLLNPTFISMIIGMTLAALGARTWMPALVTNFVGDLGSCYVPISLLLTGFSIADYPMNDVFNRPKSYLFTLLRLIVIPLFVLGIAFLLKLPLDIAILIVLAFAGPSGMNVVVFPASYGQDCRTGASIVLLSSLGSIITVPILYALVQYFFT